MRQLHDELFELFRFDLRTLVTVSEDLPLSFESFKVVGKAIEWVVWEDIVLLELLDDNQDEEIEHDVVDQQIEYQEEDGGKGRATSLALNALWPYIHTIIHDSIPVFASGYREQQGEALMEVDEVFVLADNVAFSDLAEHCVSKDSIDEENEHQENEDIQEGANRHNNGLK